MSDEQEIIDCFRLLDKDKSGFIAASELVSPPPPRAQRELAASCRLPGDLHTAPADSLVSIRRIRTPPQKKTEPQRHIMLNLGEKMSDSEIDAMIDDAGGGSKIDYAKFVKDMNRKAAGGQ